MKKVIDWLESQHRQIMDCEDEAMTLLARDDKEGYAKKMHAKAEMLATLAKRAEPVLANLPPDKRANIEAGLNAFSQSAATALSLDSLFYMSALLYRDDHKKGEPDNLEVFIQNMKKQ